VANAAIPNRPVFRAQEVCEIADVQPYVLRSWESEFPDLGFAKTAGAPRVYRRKDVERVLRIKQLVFVDGLTLAGARKRLGDESASTDSDTAPIPDAEVAALVDAELRQEILSVRRGLQWILGVLAGDGVQPEDRVMAARSAPASTRPRPAAAKARPVKKRKR
jgi:DNA-binding transcriptional MerR regulator